MAIERDRQPAIIARETHAAPLRAESLERPLPDALPIGHPPENVFISSAREQPLTVMAEDHCPGRCGKWSEQATRARIENQRLCAESVTDRHPAPVRADREA